MTSIQWTYLIFFIVVVIALVFDLGLFSKKNEKTSIKTALWQSIFWVGLSVLFFGFMWFEDGSETALSFMSAYLMEKSLSMRCRKSVFIIAAPRRWVNARHGIPTFHTQTAWIIWAE